MATEQATYISGIGETDVTPIGSGRYAEQLAIESAQLACDDAGIDTHDIDGIFRYSHDGAISAMSLAANLGSRELRVAADIPHAGGSGAALLDAASQAIRSGVARTVLCTRTVVGAEWMRQLQLPDPLRPFYLDSGNYLRPAGWTGYLHLFGALYQEHALRYGTTRSALGRVGQQMRQNAAASMSAIPAPVYSMDEYLQAAITVSPFCHYDEFIGADLSCSVIVTGAEPNRTGPHSTPVEIVSSVVAQGPGAMGWFDTRPLSPAALDSPSRAVADELYRLSGLNPGHIDVAELYDCTTFTLFFLLEESRRCERGEAVDLVSGDALLATGARPTNTHGGDLTGGYSHGFRQILEAVRQLRGTAKNQVVEPEHALVLGPPAGPTSGAILRRCAT